MDCGSVQTSFSISRLIQAGIVVEIKATIQ